MHPVTHLAAENKVMRKDKNFAAHFVFASDSRLTDEALLACQMSGVDPQSLLKR